jgi:SAM-dependent methyltransferase
MKNSANRLYGDLAWLWPIWEDVEEYRKESELFTKLIKQNAKIEVHSLLDMGCGGGKNAFHLKRHFAVTGIDISEAMLSNAKNLNPECEFLVGDMREFDLGRQFDSAFINDSITYMTTKEDLFNTFRSAYKHLRAGGLMITYPDVCKETFSQNKTRVSTPKASNMDITFVENSYDPNPEDDTYELTFIFLIREAGKLRIEHDFHICGLFTLDVWGRLLREAGFTVREEGWDQDTQNLPVFVCAKPL